MQVNTKLFLASVTNLLLCRTFDFHQGGRYRNCRKYRHKRQQYYRNYYPSNGHTSAFKLPVASGNHNQRDYGRVLPPPVRSEGTCKGLATPRPAMLPPAHWSGLVVMTPSSSLPDCSCDISLFHPDFPFRILGNTFSFSFQFELRPIYPALMQNWMVSRAIGAASVDPCSPPSTRTAIAIFFPVLSSAKPQNQASVGASVEPVLP